MDPATETPPVSSVPPKPRITTKERFKRQLELEIEERKQMLASLEGLGLENLEFSASFYSNNIDFDNLPHDKVIEVIKAIGGKWSKEINGGDRVDYSTTKNGVRIRCWKGEPPPNCKIVDVLETIPAQPERVVTVKKLVCK